MTGGNARGESEPFAQQTWPEPTEGFEGGGRCLEGEYYKRHLKNV